MRNWRQKLLRHVRSEVNAPLMRFTCVNDDDLGVTYVAGFVRGDGYVIVEAGFIEGIDDMELTREYRAGGLTIHYTVVIRDAMHAAEY